MCRSCRYYQEAVVLPKFQPAKCLLSGKRITEDVPNCWGYKPKKEEGKDNAAVVN